MRREIIIGDCREMLATLPAESVQCVVTSPPYFGLRDYGTAEWDGGDPECDHGAVHIERRQAARQPSLDGGVPGSLRDKPSSICKCGARRVDSQIGLEQSPAEYVAQLVAVFREVRRVLRKDGVAWLNIGDSYAGGGGGNYSNGTRNTSGQNVTNVRNRPEWLKNAQAKPKDLLLIPARVAIALQEDGWWIRSEIIWSKSAPMPESVRDRPTCAHEKVWLLTKSANYFYDSDAVAEPASTVNDGRRGDGASYSFKPTAGATHMGASASGTRNMRNVLHLNPEPSGLAHFAMMPTKLAEICIKAGTSEKGQCPHCGGPWVRVVERQLTKPGITGGATPYDANRPDGMTLRAGGFGGGSATTNGWQPSCACPAHEPVPQTVLDPFAGAGTTLLVADRLQRHSIGIELSPDNISLMVDRTAADAPLLDVATPPQPEQMDLLACA